MKGKEAIAVETEVGTKQSTIEIEKPGKSRQRKIIIILIAALLVILIAGGAYAYIGLDLGKSPKKIYFEAEAKDLNTMMDFMTSQYTRYQDAYIKPYQDNTVTSDLTMSMEVKGISPSDARSKMLLDLLEKSKLKVHTERDDKNQRSYGKMDLALAGSNLLGVEGFMDKTKIGFAMPVIYDKYVLMDLKDKDLLEEKYGLNNLPNQVVKMDDIIQALSIPEKDLRKVFSGYAKLYAQHIQADQVILDKGAVFEEENTRIPARKITVTFTKEQWKALQRAVATRIGQDEALVDLVYNKQTDIWNLMEKSGYSMASDMQKLNKEEIKENMQGLSRDLLQQIEQSSLDSSLVMTLYVDNADYILERTIALAGDKETDPLVRIARWTDKTGDFHGIIYVGQSKGNDNTAGQEIQLTYTGTPKETAPTGQAQLTITDKTIEATPAVTTLQAKYAFTLEDFNKTYDIQFELANDSSSPKVVGHWTNLVTENKKDKTTDSDASLQLNLNIPEQNMENAAIHFQMQGKDVWGQPVALPTITKENSIDLAHMSGEEMVETYGALQKGMETFLNQNLSLMQTFFNQ